MQNNYRILIYAFLSRFFTTQIDESFYKELKKNKDLLATIGVNSFNWVDTISDQEALKQLNVDFTSMFEINTQPVESFVLDAKQESLVGLQNPVMQFYFNHGYDVNMNQTKVMAPDHISIEFAFMQALVQRDEKQVQLEFLTKHLGLWAVPYFMGMKSMATTPIYEEICDFIVEFLVADIDSLSAELANGN